MALSLKKFHQGFTFYPLILPTIQKVIPSYLLARFSPLSPNQKYIYIYFIILESSRAVAAFFLNPLLPFTISMAVLPRGIIPRDTDPWILTDWSFCMERRGREGRDRFHLRWTCLFLARFLPDHLLFYLDTGSIYSLRWNGRIYRISSSRRDVSTDSPLFRVFFKIPCTPSQAAPGPSSYTLLYHNEVRFTCWNTKYRRSPYFMDIYIVFNVSHTHVRH